MSTINQIKFKSKRLARLFLFRFKLGFIYEYMQYIKLKKKTINQVFQDIYLSNFWGSSESISGSGSSIEQTRILVREINSLFKKYNFEKVLDIPCGDFHWMKEANNSKFEYIGADIVPELIISNKKKFNDKTTKFLTLNLLDQTLPSCDLILCRDCLVHFSNEDIFKSLKNILRTNANFILTTTFIKNEQNKNIATGQWRPLNLLKPPFNFPKPILIINEGSSENRGHSQEKGEFFDKCLALWDIASLREHLTKSKLEIYAISLLGTKRNKVFKKYLKNNDFEVKIIKALAVENKDFPIKKNNLSYLKHNEFNAKDKKTDREIACFISHMEAIKKSDKNKSLLLLEDDARLKISFKVFHEILSELEKVKKFDIILLGFSRSDNKTEEYLNLVNPFVKSLRLQIKDHKYYVGERFKHSTSGALSYLITPKGKQKLIKFKKIFRVADDWPLVESLGLNVGYLKPTIIEEDMNVESSLDHEQYFIRPRKTGFLINDLIISLGRRVLFCYRFSRVLIKKFNFGS